MNKSSKSRENLWKIFTIILGASLVLSLAGNIWLFKNLNQKKISYNPEISLEANIGKKLEKVSAKDIYPLFECPCCSQPLNECTCPMAKERKAFIDGLVKSEFSENKILLSYVKKYGLDSFIDKEKEKEFRQKLVKEAPAERPIISITPEFYDLGEVSQRNGIVTIFFEIRNQGKNDLIIDRLETSCGCTSASIVYQGKESPKFSMPGHGIEEKIKNWQLILPPDEKAKLKVYYDPNFHKEFKGYAIREISVFSNDPVDFKKTVQIELVQVK